MSWDIFKLYTMYYCVFPRNIQTTSDIMKHIITTFVIEDSADLTSALPETVTNLVIIPVFPKLGWTNVPDILHRCFLNAPKRVTWF